MSNVSSDPPRALLGFMPFSEGLGITLEGADASNVVGTLAWSPERCTSDGILHGCPHGPRGHGRSHLCIPQSAQRSVHDDDRVEDQLLSRCARGSSPSNRKTGARRKARSWFKRICSMTRIDRSLSSFRPRRYCPRRRPNPWGVSTRVVPSTGRAQRGWPLSAQGKCRRAHTERAEQRTSRKPPSFSM